MVRFYKLTYALLTLALAGGYLFHIHNHASTAEDFSCTGTLKKNAFLPDGSEVGIDASIYLLVGKNNQGVVNFNGAITQGDDRYRLKRLTYFDYSHPQGSPVYNLIWREMDPSGDDNVPPALNFMIHPVEKQTFFQFRKLEGNIIMLERNGFPLLACVLSQP